MGEGGIKGWKERGREKKAPGSCNERVVMCLSVQMRSLIRAECLLSATSSSGHSGSDKQKLL